MCHSELLDKTSEVNTILNILRCRQNRLEEATKKRRLSEPINYLSSTVKHNDMSKTDLIVKIKQKQGKIKDLQSEITKLNLQYQKEMKQKGVILNELQSAELKETMSQCNDEVLKAHPDANSLPRLFWCEQLKNAKAKSKCGMRWYPMIIRWCLYLRHKSSAAYDALRETGFITLPSTRTLFDYSHYTKSAFGFQPDVVHLLKTEARKRGMYSEDHKCYVGILFDEIKVKSDLVYDKHNGELIGYCNLDKVGNQILELESKVLNDGKKNCDDKQTDMASYMLVLMVRGIVTNLVFPLAAFATTSISSDFLYPIIWKAVRILECAAKLKVLFLTCDGASPNRRFFKINSQGQEMENSTENPHDPQRQIYFISDVPHLLKTTRNCFSNSNSHRRTRRLCNDGKSISWLHIVRLFEEHCQLGIYNPCPKLTRNHIDLNAFSYMKVSLAAQVLSSTVANSLDYLYGDEVSETSNFMRHINCFFGCLNVRSLFEGRNKQNPSLEPYTLVDDGRLTWLVNGFLDYFDDWEQSVHDRGANYTSSERNAMQLSKQTLQGLRLSVHSIVDCVRFMLEQGAGFIMTNVFNQDPLEQHFGHLRHRTGSNNNPTVYDVRNAMTEMRVVGATAITPKHGNITREGNDVVIDNTPLPRRPRS